MKGRQISGSLRLKLESDGEFTNEVVSNTQQGKRGILGEDTKNDPTY